MPPISIPSDHLPTQKEHPVVWSVAGSDSGGGAGIQADQRAFECFGVHGCFAVAALTAQNSVAVEAVEPVSPAFLDAQLAALAKDMPPAAIKTGMLASVENVRVVAKWVDALRKRSPQAASALVVDPILRASTGRQFAGDALRQAMLQELLPRATVVKPNLKEALWLVTGQEKNASDIDVMQMPELAKALRAFGARSVVITGGDYCDETGADYTSDWLDTPQVRGWLSLPRVDKSTMHGTGCTLTASVAGALALGFCEADAVILAKMAATYAVREGYVVGAGTGMVYAGKDFAVQPGLLPYLSASPLSSAPSLGGDGGLSGFPALSDPQMGLYAIMDSFEWVKCVVDAGVRTVQLRIKADDVRIQGEQGRRFLSEEVRCSSQYARAAGVQFFVNDHWELALEHGAYGVHLGQEDLPHADLKALREAGLRLGVSTYSLWDVCIAKAVKPSYYACGPIYETQSKVVNYLSQGLDNLAYFSHMLDRPVVAIGGIDLARACDVVRSGAKGVAVISAIMGQESPEQAIAQLQGEIVKGRGLPRFAVPLLPHSVL